MPLDNISQMINGGINSIGDYQRLQQEFELKKQLAQAEIAKSQQLDVDKLGERAFMKAAMGEPLTPQELAAARLMDAKSGGVSFNPVTGEMLQKPRISDKINIGGDLENIFPTQNSGRTLPPFAPTGMGNPAINQGYDSIIPTISESDLGDAGQSPTMGDNESAASQLIQREPYFQTPKGQAESAKLLLDARLKDIETNKIKNKPMPASVLALQNKVVGEASGASNVIDTTQKYIGMVDDKKLDLGPVSNLISQGRNFIGQSNETSRNFNSFKSDLEKMRNDSLRLNSGVQTDGDAQRAWNELMANINDPLTVRQRLEEINGYNQTALAIKQGQIEDIRTQYGKEPIDLSGANKKLSPDYNEQLQTEFENKKKPRLKYNPASGELE